jgi:zinc protease
VRLVHRPGAVQTEVRVGHVGLRRRIPDFHAVSVMSAILGGLFGSRLNMRLREEKGYTYGAGAGYDFRRFAGPFSARAAVNTDATVPALTDLLAELRRIRDAAPSDAEMRAARDYLVGVFPLRFETPGPIVGALGGLVTFGLPADELDRYRPAINAVTGADVLAAARTHLHVERLAVIVVGDADAVGADLEKAGIGDVEVVRELEPVVDGA